LKWQTFSRFWQTSTHVCFALDCVEELREYAADRHWAEKASAVWLTHAGVREKIIEHLEASGRDESAIEAETMRRVAYDVEMLDRMMALLERAFERRSAQLRITARPLPIRCGWLQTASSRLRL
jgi:hypothetical protein